MSEIALYADFAEKAMLNRKQNPWYQKRKPAEYAQFEIASAANDKYWYADFIGVRFWGIIQWGIKPGEIKEARVILFAGNYIHHGRSVPGRDLFLL